jgi:uncharacterized spore protein YtfJ
MDVQDVMGQARDALTVKRVFGDPIERDGVTVVPVARVMGGSGFGTGTGPAGESDDEGGSGAAAGSGTGAGFGMMGGPAGVYVIKGDQVTWQPAVNPERIVLVSGFVAFLLLFAVRGILKVLVRR